jgi:hypothetical protein
MPSTRSQREDLLDEMDFDESDDDPDYREDSADDSDELPVTRGRDRAQWCIDNLDAVQELYAVYLSTGRQIFGGAFHQIGSVTEFAHFVYRYTTPGAD